MHLRVGRSVAGDALAALEPAAKPKVQKAYVAKRGSEAALVGSLFQIRDAARLSGEERYPRRPDHPDVAYCGIDEFDGVFRVCEVKNRDGSCRDYQRADRPSSRSCQTCVHNVLPATRARIELDKQLQFAARHTQAISEDHLKSLKETIDGRAEFEFEAAVLGQGFLDFRPGLLPICTARSNGQTVVGPIVNVGSECDRWEAGQPASRADDRLDELIAAVAEAKTHIDTMATWSLPTPPSVLEGMIWSDWDHMRWRRARIDLISYCLTVLALPDLIDGVEAAIVYGETPNQLDDETEARARAAYRYVVEHHGQLPLLPPELAHAAPKRGNGSRDAGSGSGSGVDQSGSSSDGQRAGQRPGGLLGFLAGLAGGTGSDASGSAPAPSDDPRQAPPSARPAEPLEPSFAPPATPTMEPPVPAIEPFFLEANREYRHPKHKDVRITLQWTPIQAVLLVRNGRDVIPHDPWSIPFGSWTQLHGPDGPLPVAVMSQLPQALYASWV